MHNVNIIHLDRFNLFINLFSTATTIDNIRLIELKRERNFYNIKKCLKVEISYRMAKSSIPQTLQHLEMIVDPVSNLLVSFVPIKLKGIVHCFLPMDTSLLTSSVLPFVTKL